MNLLNESKIKNAKKKSRELILLSTSHGLSNAFRSKRISMKFMWFFLFTASTSFGVSMVIRSILQYLQFEVVTKIDIINEKPTEFPAITVYNLKNTKANHSLKSVLILCYFNREKCTEKDFDVIKDRLGLFSYRFKKREVYLAGQFYGLQMLMNNIAEPTLNLFHDGFGIIVHNHSIDPGYYGGFSNEGVIVSPSSSTDLVVDRTFSNKLSKPHTSCIDKTSSFNSDLYNYIITKTNYSYRQQDCFDYCYGRELNKYFNISTKIDNYNNVMAILNTEFNISLPELLSIYYSLNKGSINEICGSLCPLECDSIEYRVTATFSNLLLSDKMYNLFKNRSKIKSGYNSHEEEFKRNLYFVSIYYNDLKYTSITQTPKTNFLDLVSSIGGILGLFIGISFLSFAEIIELCLEIFLIFFKNRRKP